MCKSAVDTNTRARRHACDSTAPWDESVRLFRAGVERVEMERGRGGLYGPSTLARHRNVR